LLHHIGVLTKRRGILLHHIGDRFQHRGNLVGLFSKTSERFGWL
jgi:hypothetical protein